MANKQLLLNLLVTASLALPGIAAGAFQHQVSESEKIMASHPVRLPDSLGAAKAAAFATDEIAEPNVVRRRYFVASNRPVWGMCRQTSIYSQIHDFTDCMIAAGRHPEVLRTVDINTDSGVLRAQIIASQGKHKSLSMLWFQTGTVCGADRWEWREKLLISGAAPQLPMCRVEQVSVAASGNQQEDVRVLTDAAVALYRSQVN